ncbi:hypothetical protein QBC32DRAFT_369061 [Pseudoneurospora amorphoporcata]|uniref:Uncharacterized protein n=1 Tax=Pseudoneurospora amorphoporcata TaxID=241081 RepID=A0AAN6NXG9_9PEZI|nr:hypothetical protein QBC32DRAFT_369061 [Pseudoneurospora amorphoporcata]
MDKLPQEVVDAIAAHLFPSLVDQAGRVWFSSDADSLRMRPDSLSAAPYATISAPWQRAVESLTFHSLTLSTREDVSYAEECLRRNEHRRARIAFREVLGRHMSYTWRDHHIASKFCRVIEFINRLWPPTTDSSVPARRLCLLVKVPGRSQSVVLEAFGEPGGGPTCTETPASIRELPACPAVTSLDIMYETSRDTMGLWRPAFSSRECSARVWPPWLVEIAPKFPSLYR